MSFKFWFLCFIIMILLGLSINAILTSIVTAIVLKNEKESFGKLYQNIFKINLSTGFGLSLALCLLYSVKKIYNYNIEIILLGTLFISGLISSIETKSGLNFLVGCSALIYPLIYSLIVWIILKIKTLKEKRGNINIKEPPVSS